jgi:hypothetical protein
MAKQSICGWVLVIAGLLLLMAMARLDWLPVLLLAALLLAHCLSRVPAHHGRDQGRQKGVA